MKLFRPSILFTISFLLSMKETYADDIKIFNSCEKVIESIQLQTDIPKGLLLSIGKTEAIKKNC